MLRRILVLVLLALAACRRGPEKPHVVLISIDTLRSDRVSPSRTPNLHALAADGITFERAFSHVPLTLPSHASVFTGLLRQRLRLVGRRHGAPTGNLARSGGTTVELMTRWIASNASRPFFAFVHLFEPHAPYEPTYEADVAAADRHVGALLESLRQSGLYDDALIVLLSDHGEGLGDHGEQEHGVLLLSARRRRPGAPSVQRNALPAHSPRLERAAVGHRLAAPSRRRRGSSPRSAISPRRLRPRAATSIPATTSAISRL